MSEEHLFYSKESSENTIDEAIVLGTNHTYQIIAGIRDRDFREATIRGEVPIMLDDSEMTSKDISHNDRGDENFGPSVWDSIKINILNNETANLTIIGTMDLADYWLLEIYEDLPDIGIGSLAIILMVSEYASIFSGAWLVCALLRMTNKKQFSSESDEEDEQIEDGDLGVIYYD
ncbi:MAG: hypothetical protein GF411_03745 [Candidatus Lokiarchaeota archaeon]|nr:hypothetical protein [Candidatus Lokiarchaeota archaeon]